MKLLKSVIGRKLCASVLARLFSLREISIPSEIYSLLFLDKPLLLPKEVKLSDIIYVVTKYYTNVLSLLNNFMWGRLSLIMEWVS